MHDEDEIKMSFFKSDEEKLQDELKKQQQIKLKIEENAKKLKLIQEKETAKEKIRKEKEELKRQYDKFKRKGILDFNGWKNVLLNKFFPGKILAVNMELRNGFHTHFIVKLDKPTFIYNNGTYAIDDSLKYYDISSQLWMLDYHEDFSLPIGRKWPVDAIKKSCQKTGITDIENSINPFTLKGVIESEVIQKVIKGDELEAVFRFLKMMAIINCVIGAIILIVIIKASGVLNNIHLPGFG